MYNHDTQQHREELTRAVVFVVIDEFRNRRERVLLSKVVTPFHVLPYVIMLYYACFHTTYIINTHLYIYIKTAGFQ